MACTTSMEGPGSKLGVTLNSIGNHHYQQMQTMDNNPNTNGHQNNNQTLGSEMTHPDGTIILSGSSGQHGHGSSEDRNVHNAKDEEKHSKIEAKSLGPPSTETEKDKEHVEVAGDTAKNTQTEETKPPGYKDNKTSDEARQHSTHCETLKIGDTQTSQNRVQLAPAKHKRTNSSEPSTRPGSLIPHAASSLKQNDQNTPESKDQSGGTTDRSELNLSSRSKEAWTENTYEIEDAKRGASTANDPNKGKQASIGDTQTSQNRVQSAPAKHKRTKLPESNTRPGSSIPHAASSLKQNEQNPSESKDLFRGITDRSLPSRSNEAWPENTYESEDANRGARQVSPGTTEVHPMSSGPLSPRTCNKNQGTVMPPLDLKNILSNHSESSSHKEACPGRENLPSNDANKDIKKRNHEYHTANINPDTEAVEPSSSAIVAPDLPTQVSKHDRSRSTSQYKMQLQAEPDKIKEERGKDERLKNQYEQELKNQNQEIAELKAKLNEFSRLGEDETSLENINIPVRPMTVAEDYTLFRNVAWVEAADDLDDQFENEESRYRFLSDVLLISEVESTKAYSSTLRDVEKHLMEPFIEKDTVRDDSGDTNMSSRMLLELKDIFRKHANKCRIDKLVKIITAEVHSKHKDVPTSYNLERYIEEAARLTWKMVLQKPPMKFDISHVGRGWSKPVEKETGLELQFGSVTKGHGCKIRFYVFPALLHGDKIMSKGSVFVGP